MATLGSVFYNFYNNFYNKLTRQADYDNSQQVAYIAYITYIKLSEGRTIKEQKYPSVLKKFWLVLKKKRRKMMHMYGMRPKTVSAK